MRGWRFTPEISSRWTGGTFKESKLSDDEKAVYKELGTPDAIRFFRATQTRQTVYEWIYEEQVQVIWFVDGERVEYVAVDTNTSSRSKETRETTQRKLKTGAALGAVVGGVAAGFMLLGDSLGLKD
jgi:hypothetical protein